jgi:hypothetical protein
MVQRTKITLVDDVNGDETAVETIQFGLDGLQYEIDLGEDNAIALRRDIEEWAGYARRIGGRRKHKTKTNGQTNGHKASATPSSAAEVRAWAQSQGVEVPPRGRVPADVRAAFEQANSSAA